MSFKSKCPHCQYKFDAEDEWLGQEAECAECGEMFTIRKLKKKVKKALPVSSHKPQSTETFDFICPECNTQTKVTTDIVGETIECEGCGEEVEVFVPEFKLCPHCNEQIKIKAKVCKHCKMKVADITQSRLGDDEKECPNCGKVIKKKALLCKYCKSSLGTSVQSTPMPQQYTMQNYPIPPGFEHKTITLWNVYKVKDPKRYGGFSQVAFRLLPFLGFLGCFILLFIPSPTPQKSIVRRAQDKGVLFSGILLQVLWLMVLALKG